MSKFNKQNSSSETLVCAQPQKKAIDGILLLDKPTGITSNKALQQVKYLCQAKKAGHSGNLDPLATGLLPICFGEATKFAGFLLNTDKGYVVTAKLGESTDTGDGDGQVIASKEVPSLSYAKLQQILLGFQGEIAQLPPMYSAIKYKGQPLYKLARKGIEVTREARRVTIYKIELISLHKEFVTLLVHCSKGTYIRTLLEDLGTAIGCGAHVVALRRILFGKYKVEDAVSIAKLQDILVNKKLAVEPFLLPIDSAIIDWPIVKVSESSLQCLVKGQQIAAAGAPSYGLVRINVAGNGSFIGIGEALGAGMIAPKRLINTTGLIP